MDPLPCRWLSPSCGERCPQQLWTWMLYLSPLTDHMSKTPHRLLYTVCQFLLNDKAFDDLIIQDNFINICNHIYRLYIYIKNTEHRYSPNDLSSEPNTCLIWTFSMASWLTGGLVEEAEEEDGVTGFWTEEDTI